MMTTLSRPIAVFISDVHFTLKTLQVASNALTAALEDAEAYEVPLVIAGDLHDTKAILRGECVTAIISILKNAKVPVKVLVGNHDKIHEKSEAHALEFLRPYVDLIDSTRVVDEHFGSSIGFIPYQSTNEAFLNELKQFRKGTTIVVHQGFKGAFMGEYVKDESSVHPDTVKDYRIISGHYHRHQTLGTITYIGTPYTTSFAEANDGPKGYLTLYSDGAIEQTEIILRRHVIIETTLDHLNEADEHGADPFPVPELEDLVWLKVRGPSIGLDKLTKKQLSGIFGHQSFKLDKIATDVEEAAVNTDILTDEQIMDSIIDQDNQSDDNKMYLKALWRELLK